MSPTRHELLLIVDACVLIDFVRSDRSVLTLAARHLGTLHVATPVLEEVDDLGADEAVSMGIQLYEPSLDQAAAAAAERGRLSFEDRLCFLIARDQGFTCVSNDKPLRDRCKAEGVPTLWGFELLGRLVERDALTAAAAGEIATRIAEDNKRIGHAVLARFLRRLGLGGR